MTRPPTKRRAAAVQFLLDNPQVAKRRLAMMLHAAHPELFGNVETARTTIRYVTGTSGEECRQSDSVAKAKLNTPRAGSKVYSLPKGKAKQWTPYEVGVGTTAIFSDLHIPLHDEAAIEAAVNHVKQLGQIDTVLLNGDIADATEFSSWAKSPKAIETESSLDSIRAGLLYFCDQFPESRIIYKMGNHEERLERYCWSRAPELVGLEHITWRGLLTIDNELNKIPEIERIEFVGDQRPIMCGKLPIFHGHELPRGLTNAVNPARGAFLRMIDTALIAHHHRSSSHVEYDWKHSPINCWSVGCLCDLTPEYARINKWNHGHAVIEVSASGNFNVANYKQMDGNEIAMA